MKPLSLFAGNEDFVIMSTTERELTPGSVPPANMLPSYPPDIHQMNGFGSLFGSGRKNGDYGVGKWIFYLIVVL